MGIKQKVILSENFKFLWHFSIQTDHAIEFQRLDLVLIKRIELAKFCSF